MPQGIYPRTKEQYRKIGLANAIKLKGRKLSMETKKRMSIAKRKRIEELGYMNSPDARKKLSETWKRKWANGEVTERQRTHIKGEGINTQFKKGHEVNEKTREAVRKNRAKQIFPIKDTSIEVKIQNFLKELGIEFFTHFYIKDIKLVYRCDIFIPSIKLIIECDGDYWHGNPKIFSDNQLSERIINQRQLDEIRTMELQEKGYKILRFWENKIKDMSLNDFKMEVKKIGGL